jgi:hypothetical protein
VFAPGHVFARRLLDAANGTFADRDLKFKNVKVLLNSKDFSQKVTFKKNNTNFKICLLLENCSIVKMNFLNNENSADGYLVSFEVCNFMYID